MAEETRNGIYCIRSSPNLPRYNFNGIPNMYTSFTGGVYITR